MREQWERLLDELNAATLRKGEVAKRFKAMRHPVDPNDPVFTEWEDADADERRKMEVVREFWLRPQP